MKKLTDSAFWEDYWQNSPMLAEVNLSSPFDRCLSLALKQNLGNVNGCVFEIGCAPGKWLAFMANQFGLEPAGIEYSHSGMRATERNLATLKIETVRVIAGDFFEIDPSPEYDIVMSFGFIEHFEKPEEVVERHLAWLKPGGKLVIGVPNLNGIYNPIQKVLKPEILDKHNLSIMNLEWFEIIATNFCLEKLFIGYIGSFDPSLPIADQGVSNLREFGIKILLRLALIIRRFVFFDKFNSSFFSSYILAIYQKAI